ncbi:MAG: phosphonate C-P lyase system protein PhnG [Pseudomonadota bacterium]
MENWPHDRVLRTLAAARPEGLRTLGEALIPSLGEVEVLSSRTGLVMLPMRDPCAGRHFHLGEVLVAEAHVRASDAEGYGMRRGRDLEAAMAMALVDLALARGVAVDRCRDFLEAEAAHRTAADTAEMRDVAATRVEMETF